MTSNYKFIHAVMERWPAYRDYVEYSGINPDSVRKLGDLPIMTRTFIETAINTMPSSTMQYIIPSSGTTGGVCSFGIFNTGEIARATHMIDAYLNDHFNVTQKRTLIINMLPGSVSIPSGTASVATVGVRLDTALNTIRMFSNSFEQIILIGEPLFLLHLVERGMEESVPFEHMPLYIVTGGEWFSEPFRLYIESVIGRNRLYSSMGTAELGLNCFYETSELVLARRLIHTHPQLRNDLFGDFDLVPMLFEINERNIVVETIWGDSKQLPSIVVTATDTERSLPMIRYNIGDKGMLIPRETLSALFRDFGLDFIKEGKRSHILAHFGRGKQSQGLSPERVQELLYSDPIVAELSTGQFMFTGCNAETPGLLFQLKNGLPVASVRKHFERVFEYTRHTIEVIKFEQYPNAINYEQKGRYFK